MKTKIPYTLNHRKAGFSLMEMIIVLALIAIIAGLVVTRVGGLFSSGQEDAAKIWVKQAKTPLLAYRIHVGSYPSTEEGLKALLKAPAGKESRWRGPYIDEIPVDPWGNPYQYRYPGVHNQDEFDVWSWGPDGKESDDDIGNW